MHIQILKAYRTTSTYFSLISENLFLFKYLLRETLLLCTHSKGKKMFLNANYVNGLY